MLRTLQNLVRAPLASSLGILRPASNSVAQKSYKSSWFSENQLKLDDKHEDKNSYESSTEKYDPYPNFDAYTPSPYKNDRGIRKFYELKMFKSGVLPRPDGEWEDRPLPMPIVDPIKADKWQPKKALFGQNDYIDILGDGTVHPWELIVAPIWLKGFRGNEYQRLIRRLAMQGDFLRENYPSTYNQIVKQIRFLYKKINRRRTSSSFGGYRRFSRLDKPRERY